MAYTKQTWTNGSGGGTPISAARLGVIEDGVEATAVVADAAVTKALFDANTVLYATTDNTPVALTIGASTIVGRKASGNIVALTGAETLVILGVTAAGLALVDDADAPAQRTTLGLGTIATQAASAVAITGGAITGSAITGSTREVTFSRSSGVVVMAGTTRWYASRSYTIGTVRASVGVAPTGQSLLVDVNKNGTTIFTTQGSRPTITAAGFTDVSDAPDVTTLVSGDYLSVDIDQIGTTVPGSQLLVQINLTTA